MPLYEYQCEACGTRTTFIMKVEDIEQDIACTCGKKMKKQISKTSFKLTGPGWAKDGYGNDKSGNRSGSA